ncbi:unnamed protein product [Paramecium pentaurelia]|uniref:Uncharacterized protein n=1 Tax=Paramecium pentaurelia TaxID=43138 RepID=A0A8S1VWD9_9CILI|nr:unnamed protein product [Paramecium pentaurelia]
MKHMNELLHYIKQYNLARYYQKIQENANLQENNQSIQKKLIQYKLNVDQEENIKKDMESQDKLQRQENILHKRFNRMKIDVMEKIEKKQRSRLKLQKIKQKIRILSKNKSQLERLLRYKRDYQQQIILQDQNKCLQKNDKMSKYCIKTYTLKIFVWKFKYIIIQNLSMQV